MICVCDYDPPEFWSARDVKACRKSFSCEECGRIVPVGSPYEYISGRWDGYLNGFKTCRGCVDLRTWMKRCVPCFCWAHCNLFEDVIETAREARFQAPEETVGLLFGAYRRIERLRRAARASRATT